MYKIPSNYSLLYNAEEISKETLRLGPEIAPWIQEQNKNTGKPVLALCVLKGAVFFFSDLLRAIPEHMEAEFCTLNTYSGNQQQMSDSEIPPVELSRDIRGHSILIIDDICDTGRVLSLLTKDFSSKGAVSVKSAVMVYRDTEHSTFKPDYYAFKIKNEEWLVGMGFDDNNLFRNLPSIYTINK